jgi:hypothetical protein
MVVDWVATDPDSGRFSGVFRVAAFAELEDRLAALRARGEGYFQVARTDSEYPWLLLGFRGSHAVLYRLDSPDTMLIHVGDATVSRDHEVTVLVMEDHNDIGGKFVLRLDRAWRVVKEFAATGATGEAKNWLEL